MRDEEKKEERSKQGQTNNKAKQHSTPKAVVTFSKKNELPQVDMYVLYLHSMHGCLYTLFLCMIWTNVAHSDLDTPEWVLLLCDSAFTHPSLYIAELYSGATL